MSSFSQDIRYALRNLAHSPGFTLAALLSLALGIGANTAIFTLTNAVFLNPLPVKDASRVLELYTVDHATPNSGPNLTRTPVSYANLFDIRDKNDVFSGLSMFTQGSVTLTGFGKPLRQPVFLVSANYFDMLGVQAAKGRVFRSDEDRTPGGDAVAVLSHSLAQRLFGADRESLGRTLNLNSIAYTIIGVAPAGFKGTLTIGPPDSLWIPISMHTQVFQGVIERFFNERRFRFLNAFGRLKPGVDEQRALANLQTIASALEAAYPRDNKGRTIEVAPLNQAALGFLPRGQTVAAAVAMSAAVGFVLLIACANLANLSLARATKRTREMSIRTALGAPRSRLIRQLLTEAELLSMGGGLLGIAGAWAVSQLLWNFRPAFLQPGDLQLALDWRVCAFTAVVSVLTGLLFGIAPVFRATMPDLSSILNSGGRGGIQGGGRNRLRKLLVVGEVALALVALAGAGLFIRSMQRAQRIDLGFETRNLAVFGFDLGSQHMGPEKGREFLRAAIAKVKTIPGVVSAAVADTGPLNVGFVQTAFREGDPVDSRLGTLTPTPPVSPGYFDTMRIPLIAGRDFNSFDREGSQRVVVVSDAMARRMWPGQSALGKRFRFATSPDLWEVVGVVKNTTIFNIGEAPQPVVYMPVEQEYRPVFVMHVRTAGDPQAVLPAALGAVQSLDPDLALVNPAPVGEVIGQALWAPRMAAGLFGGFGLLSLVLAVIGVYGVMAFMVLQRTNEIGVRIALGARPRDVTRMVVGESMRLAIAGIVVGTALALGLTRLVQNLLYDVSPSDPLTFVGVAAILALTGLVAGGIPAWRAARIDPVCALRCD